MCILRLHEKEMARDEPTNLFEESIPLIDRIAMRWVKSRLIDRPVRHCRVVIRRQKLSKQVKAGALRRAQRDRSMAEEWFPIEEEAYRIKQR